MIDETPFFFSKAFIESRPEQDWWQFSFEEQAIAFHLEGQEAKSLARASFGGFLWHGPITAIMLDAMHKQLKDRGISQIRVTTPPEAYAWAITQHNRSLLQAGYQPLSVEVNYHIPVDKRPFSAHLNSANRWKMNKATRQGYQVAINPNPELELIYMICKQTRERKGYPWHMPFAQFEALFRSFPQRYQSWECWHNGALVAVSLVLLINNKIAYTLFNGDAEAHRALSPLLLVHKAIYEWAQSHHYAILDLGIATDGGRFNHTLAQFKRHLGGVESLKYQLQKVLD